MKERRIEIVNRRARSALVQLVHGGEFAAWWKARLAREGIPMAAQREIEEAQIVVDEILRGK